jgi:hypothetical protein
VIPKGKQKESLVYAVLAGAGVCLFVFVLYLRTLAPTVLPYDLPALPDADMLQAQVCVLGMTHPTGYPSYLMLTHLFTYLPFGDCAYRVNLASAVYGALALAVVYAVALMLSRSVVAAVIGTLSLGLGKIFWSQAVIAEVYTLNVLMAAITLLVLLVWRERRQDRYLLLASFLMGFALTNHRTSGLLLPAAFLFVLMVDRRKLLDWKLALKGAGLFFAGLLPYLYLPIRASMDPPMNTNNPDNWERFWYLVSGGNLTGTSFSYGLEALPRRFLLYWGHLLDNFHWALLEVGLLGLVAMLLWDRAGAVLLGVPYLGWLFHAVENKIVDVKLYFIPTYFILALWIAVGAAFLISEAGVFAGRSERLPRRSLVGVLSVALLLLPLSVLGASYAENDMSDDYRAPGITDTVVENVEKNATVLHHRSHLWYVVHVEKKRRDLTLVDPFRHNTGVSHADIVWPEDAPLEVLDRRYGTNDISGVKAAEMAAERGPVYLLAQEEANPQNFRQAGFKVVRIEGILYRLYPPGSGNSGR